MERFCIIHNSKPNELICMKCKRIEKPMCSICFYLHNLEKPHKIEDGTHLSLIFEERIGKIDEEVRISKEKVGEIKKLLPQINEKARKVEELIIRFNEILCRIKERYIKYENLLSKDSEDLMRLHQLLLNGIFFSEMKTQNSIDIPKMIKEAAKTEIENYNYCEALIAIDEALKQEIIVDDKRIKDLYSEYTNLLDEKSKQARRT